MPGCARPTKQPARWQQAAPACGIMLANAPCLMACMLCGDPLAGVDHAALGGLHVDLADWPLGGGAGHCGHQAAGAQLKFWSLWGIACNDMPLAAGLQHCKAMSCGESVYLCCGYTSHSAGCAPAALASCMTATIGAQHSTLFRPPPPPKCRASSLRWHRPHINCTARNNQVCAHSGKRAVLMPFGMHSVQHLLPLQAHPLWPLPFFNHSARPA